MADHKGRNLLHRARFAWAGLGHALRFERSFRTECLAAAIATGVTVAMRPGWLWAGLIAVSIALVLALELVNTALEHALDGLSPAPSNFVAVAKDCAAAAVLVASTLSVILFGFMLLDNLPARG